MFFFIKTGGAIYKGAVVVVVMTVDLLLLPRGLFGKFCLLLLLLH